MKKLRLGILFGGQSAEHEVSLMTAKNVFDAIDKEKYDVILIGIDKKGKWHLCDNTNFLISGNDPKLIKLNTPIESVTLTPYASDPQIIDLSSNNKIHNLDVVFPLLHGTFGEDGTIQGLLKLAHIPYVGADILGSAVAMDKDITKRLLRDSGIPITKFRAVRKDEDIPFNDLIQKYGNPFFIKPANAGSSVGVSKVRTEKEYIKALDIAFHFDNKILIEKAITGREIECSVLGNENPIVSVPGEIIIHDDFYSYNAKYINEDSASLQIPAELTEDTKKEIQNIAKKTYLSLCLEGMARVDMFLTGSNEIYVNEVNTIPGFTKISMYPKLWEASGISYSDLIDRLITLALDRHKRDAELLTTNI